MLGILYHKRNQKKESERDSNKRKTCISSRKRRKLFPDLHISTQC